ncbi:MAG: baseplate J/gp47 family protein [Chloroflexota bacterium]
MKTHILQLEPHDDILSARDKLGWAQGGRILIVWPSEGKATRAGRILHRRLDLVLLQRRCAALGAQLALVCRDPEVCFYAPRLGIPIFRSLRQAQNSPWRPPRRFRNPENQPSSPFSAPLPSYSSSPLRGGLRGGDPISLRNTLIQPPPRLHPLLRLAAFSLAVLSVLSIAAALLPGAEIRLAPEQRTQQITIQAQASATDQSVLLSGSLPAQPVNVTVEARQSIPVSGSIWIPDQPAVGEVVFTNLTDQPVTIPETTIVRTLGSPALRFTVTRRGLVPAGPGQTLGLPVRCLTLGSPGNLPAGSLVAIEGQLGTQLSASNPQPTRQGADRKEPAPTEADRQNLASRLRQSLRQSALLELQASLQPGDLLLEDSLSLVEVLDETYSPAQAQPANQLSLSLRAEFQALRVSAQDLNFLAQAVLDAALPAGFEPSNGSLSIETLGPPVFQNGAAPTARWEMRASRRIQALLPPAQAVQLALGQAPGQAQQRLADGLPLAGLPEITLAPAWWPRLPILPFRITILEQEPAP